MLLAARDAGLYNAVTDCGAGGLSSAVGEMARALGAEIELSGLGTKYPGSLPGRSGCPRLKNVWS